MHAQLGPVVKALLVSCQVIDQSVKDQIESKIDSCPFDPSSSSMSREKACLINGNNAGNEDAGTDDGNGFGFEIPKTDIVASLPSDCLTRMGLKENKDSWKKRKEALEEVESVCIQYNGLVSSAPDCFKDLVNLMRALKARLGDSQSNLKPVAARNIAAILSSVDGTAQAKLGKIVYGPLISAAMNDNKKIMRDASLDALRRGTMKLDLEGGGVNTHSMEALMQASASELIESGQKAAGLSDVLSFVAERITYFPKVDTGSKSKSRNNEAQFAQAIIKCLTSSQSETRSHAESILKDSIKNRVINISSAEKAASKLINAEQRKVRPILDSLGSMAIDDIPAEHSPRRVARPASTIPFNDSGRKSPTRPKSTVPFQRSSSPVKSRGSSRLSGRSKDRTSISRRKRSVSRSRRESTSGSKQGSDHSGIYSDLISDPAFHPLKSETAISISKSHRIHKQREHVPEYPEDPSGKDVFTDLKRSWAPLLPHASVEILFPSSGIRVQDDASVGCELLSRGIEMIAESGDEDLLINQIDLIVRWFSYALCVRETTKGMQSLISFLLKLVTLLRSQQYQFTDSESFALLPFLLEKAGAAKGRFREMIPDLITNLISDGLYPFDKYGSIICVSVIEHSTAPKTRGLAIRECQMCVEKAGLSAVGKKGILAVAKSFSDETITENKTLFLDLIETIIMKMNGDMKKFLKICGNAHLSSKAKDAIQKRVSKKIKSESSKSNKQRQSRVSMSSRRSVAPPAPGTNNREMKEAPMKRERAHDNHVVRKQEDDYERFNDDRVARGHRSDDERFNDNHVTRRHQGDDENDGPFKFSFTSSGTSRASNSYPEEGTRTTSVTETTSLSQEYTSKREANSGAAASLRERLRQIRDRHQPEGNQSLSPVPPSVQFSASRDGPPSPPRPNTLIRSIMEDVDDLLGQQIPLGKNTDKSSLALVGLRKIHAALSNGSTDSTGTDPLILSQLRDEIKFKVSFCVFKLAQMLEFGFRCGSPTHAGGISIPLISVSIAGLMAIFIDSDLAPRVSESAVSITIRQASSSLLDHRLSATSASAEYGLDPSTCKKMVKAINKLAIQATHGAKRDISFQSLLSLQLQFCLGAIEQNVPSSDVSNAHHRMSRIITKLFGRVLKAEANEPTSFSSNNFDLEAVLGSLETVLSKSQMPGSSYSVALSDTSDITDLDSMSGDKMAPCRNMCNTFMIDLLKAKQSQNNASEVKIALRKLGYLKETHSGRLFITCCNELGLDSLVSPEKGHTSPTQSFPNPNDGNYDADQLSELIFAVGGAEEDEDRIDALEDLRAFVDAHPGINLESHLSGLSAPFRKFILEQMKSPFRPPLRESSRSLLSGYSSSVQDRSVTVSANTVSNQENMTMSEKLRYLKHKINAAEETAQSVIDPSGRRTSDMPLPPSADGTSFSSPNKFSTLRQRLAAASEKRSHVLSPETNQHGSVESTALGNAAILRARLESVKRMNNTLTN
mmetsp:Transcript_363/g.549  ORF Transcript_363/g.549 Transcript_363/m.549 type:complete len:1476 (+) Transcript_363:109-4536(+)